MITLLQEPEVGSVYKFVYKNKKRAALVLDNDGTHMYCWDFTRKDYRNFRHDRVVGNVEDVTKFVRVIPEFMNKDITRHENAGYSVFPNYQEDVLYALNVKE